MRRAMFRTVEELVRSDKNVVLMYADIGSMAFKGLQKDIPDRAMNFGICEDGMISMAAGMALKGMLPILYGINPFFAERAYEQLKLNFAYQKLKGIFITTGAAYDFSTLGHSHYSPSDALLIKQTQNISFFAPGTPDECRSLILKAYHSGQASYIRLSDYSNRSDHDVSDGKGIVLKKGSKATVIAVSTMLDSVMEALGEEDVTIIYYTVLQPFDAQILKQFDSSSRVLICEPETKGTLTYDVMEALFPRMVRIRNVGVPNEILRSYGTKPEKDTALKLNSEGVLNAYRELINI